MNHFGMSRSRRCDKNNVALAVKIMQVENKSVPALIEGFDALDSVCPVSSLTGNRMSIYEAMQMLGNDKYSRALESMLQEIPAIMSDSRLSDDDRVDMMVSRLNTGSPSEDAVVREQLSKIVSDFKDSFDVKPDVKTEVDVSPELSANE